MFPGLIAGQTGAYPRVCGATRPARALEKPPWGLSPRVRGNLRAILASQIQRGPIPACAGQPWMSACLAGIEGAYPRVCGATVQQQAAPNFLGGLSPRVRGNHAEPCRMHCACGPIPACAGQPCLQTPCLLALWAYPRVCGATKLCEICFVRVYGLSPRVRGNRGKSYELIRYHGPIPACAGQPLESE